MFREIRIGIFGLLALMTFDVQAAPEDEGYGWLSGGYGALGGHRGHDAGYGQLMFGGGGGFMGLSYMAKSSKPTSGCSLLADCGQDDTSVGEVSFLFGTLFAHRLMYVAMGPARTEVTDFYCEQQEGHHNCVRGGLAGEVGWLLPNGPFGLQLRIYGNLNGFDDFVGTSIGFHFGSVHVPGAPYGRDPRRLLDKAQRQVERAQARVDRLHEDELRQQQERQQVARPVPANGDLAFLRTNAPIYDRPVRSMTTQRAAAEQPIVLKRFQENADGRWWFVGMGSTAAWVAEGDIVFEPGRAGPANR